MPPGSGKKTLQQGNPFCNHLPKVQQKELEDNSWSAFVIRGWEFLVSSRKKSGMDTAVWNTWLQSPPGTPGKCSLELSAKCTDLAPIQGQQRKMSKYLCSYLFSDISGLHPGEHKEQSHYHFFKSINMWFERQQYSDFKTFLVRFKK